MAGGLLQSVDAAAVGAVAAAGFVGLLEVQQRRSPMPLPMAVSALGAVAAVALTTTQPWWGFGVGAAATVWAFVRRLRPFAVSGAAIALDLATGGLIVLTLVELAVATASPSTAVLVGAGLALLSAVPARRGVPRRDTADVFWPDVWHILAVSVAGALAND